MFMSSNLFCNKMRYYQSLRKRSLHFNLFSVAILYFVWLSLSLLILWLIFIVHFTIFISFCIKTLLFVLNIFLYISKPFCINFAIFITFLIFSILTAAFQVIFNSHAVVLLYLPTMFYIFSLSDQHLFY
jgi:hypothetical protein